MSGGVPGLPPAKVVPLPAGERLGPLRKRARRFAEEIIGAEDVYRLVRTGTKVDVGRWFMRGRVWACFMPGEVVLFAKGRRPYSERVPFCELGASRYNHVTGELDLAPAAGVRVTGLRVPPLEGLQMLAQILDCEEEEHA